MNNFTWKDTYVAEQIRADRLLEAEQIRLLQSHESINVKGSRTSKWMIAFGAMIERLGCRLQSKYQRILRQQESAALGARMIILGESASHRKC